MPWVMSLPHPTRRTGRSGPAILLGTLTLLSGGPTELRAQGEPDTHPVLAKDLATVPASVRHLTVAGPIDDDLTRIATFTGLETLEINANHALFSADRAPVTITDDGLARLAALKRLRSLRLLGCSKLTGTAFAELASIPGLEELSLRGSHCEIAGLQRLHRLPALRRLDLASSFGWGGEALDGIARIASLEELDLSGQFALHPEDLLHLARLQRLRVLRLADVNGCWPISRHPPPDWLQERGIDDRVLAALASLTRLEELDLSRCTKLTAGGLAALAAVPNLRRLDLGQCQVTDALLERLPAGLTGLRLYGCDLRGTGLARFAAMEFLDLSHCRQVDDATLAVLPQSLRRLDLAACSGITADGIAHLRRLTRLEHLSLSFLPALRHRALPPLRDLATLRRIELMGVTAGDEALADLADLPHLAEVVLDSNHDVTPSGVRLLASCPLRRLDLGGCRGIDEAAARELARLWPEARVYSPRSRTPIRH